LSPQLDHYKHLNRRRLNARLKTQRGQEENYLNISKSKVTAKLEIGDLVLWQVHNINRKLDKQLTPKLKEPL